MRAAIYARSAIKDDSKIEEQVTLCKRYASKQGWNVVHVYMDSGASRANPEREGMQALMQDASENKFEIVLTSDHNRLAGNLADFLKFCMALHSFDVKLFTPAGEVSFETSEKKFMSTVIAADRIRRSIAEVE